MTTTDPTLTTLFLASIAITLLTATLTLACLFQLHQVRKQLTAIETEVKKETPFVVMSEAGGAPALVYPKSGRAENAPIIDRGEEERRAVRNYRRGYRSTNPLADDREPIIVE